MVRDFCNVVAAAMVASLVAGAAPALSANVKSLGCFKDQGDPTGTRGRDLDGFARSLPNNSTLVCIAECRSRGFRYAATQFSSWCFCGNSYGRFGPAANCDMKCSGGSELCGGVWANLVYPTDGRAAAHEPVPPPPPEPYRIPPWWERMADRLASDQRRTIGGWLTTWGGVITVSALAAASFPYTVVGATLFASGIGAYHSQRLAPPPDIPQVRAAREAVARLESASLRGLTPEQAADLGFVLRAVPLGHLGRVYGELDIDMISRLEAIRQQRTDKAW